MGNEISVIETFIVSRNPARAQSPGEQSANQPTMRVECGYRMSSNSLTVLASEPIFSTGSAQWIRGSGLLLLSSMRILKLSKADPFPGNNGQHAHGPPLLEASAKANESAHWFVVPFVEKNKGWRSCSFGFIDSLPCLC